jgi:hypothetical protein
MDRRRGCGQVVIISSLGGEQRIGSGVGGESRTSRAHGAGSPEDIILNDRGNGHAWVHIDEDAPAEILTTVLFTTNSS